MKRFIQQKAAFTLAEVFSPHFKGQRKAAFTLAEVLSPHFKGQRKAAFTLAEVLITLGIIGVVAAITMPTLIQNHQRKVLETAFKKSYANLSNALLMASVEIDKPSFDAGPYSTEAKDFYKLVFDKMKIEKLIEGDNIDKFESKGYKGYTKKPIKSAIPTQSQGIINYVIADGSAIGGIKNSRGYYFTIDTNGIKKGPNAYGHDIFIFILQSDSYPKLLPVNDEFVQKTDEDGNPKVDDDGSYWRRMGECSKSSSQYSNGFGCTPFAVQNVCPDDNTKTYWQCLP